MHLCALRTFCSISFKLPIAKRQRFDWKYSRAVLSRKLEDRWKRATQLDQMAKTRQKLDPKIREID